jgi:Fe-S cluster biogenesis protein NfuA|tara:strand:- start:15 stop:350 length:336 start_codon:yes stop_codon:yes gene_type:complete
MVQSTSPMSRYWWKRMAEVDKQLILESVGPVQAILDAHDGVVNVIDTTDGVIMISLEGGCTGCASTPMTAMQIYYSLMKLEMVNDVIFVNGELPAYMRAFIDDKLGVETTE